MLAANCGCDAMHWLMLQPCGVPRVQITVRVLRPLDTVFMQLPEPEAIELGIGGATSLRAIRRRSATQATKTLATRPVASPPLSPAPLRKWTAGLRGIINTKHSPESVRFSGRLKAYAYATQWIKAGDTRSLHLELSFVGRFKDAYVGIEARRAMPGAPQAYRVSYHPRTGCVHFPARRCTVQPCHVLCACVALAAVGGTTTGLFTVRLQR